MLNDDSCFIFFLTFSFLPHQETCMTIQFAPSAPTPASSTTRCTTFCILKTALKLHSITPQHSSICFWSWVCHYAGIPIACIPQEDSTVWGENMTFELLSPNGQLPLPCQLYCKKHEAPWHTLLEKYVNFWGKIRYNARPQAVFGWRSETLCYWLLPGAL